MAARQADAHSRSAFRGAALTAVVLSLLASACHGNAGNSASATATDEWTRSFPLLPDGEVRIANRNGRIEVDGVSGSTVEIRAERMVRAASEKAAQDLLAKIAISEDATPSRIAITTEGIPGILIGVSAGVVFHVGVPSGARVRAELSTGDVTVNAIDGGSTLTTTNGRVVGGGLRGKTDARVVNGRINLDLAGLTDSGAVSANITNGSVELKLPADTNATLSASTVNGQVHVIELPFTPTAEADGDRRRGRRTAGQINAGGAPIDLRAVNGTITVRPR